MEENKKKSGWKCVLAGIAIVIAGTLGMRGFGMIKKQAEDRLLGNCVMTLFMLAVTFFHFHREIYYDKLDYDNREHAFRFLLCMVIGLLVAFTCGFLPVAGWPYLVVFVMLALFSNMGTGILAASSLLLISVLLSGTGVNSFVLYFVSGVFAVTLFRNLGNGFHIGIALFLSVLSLLVCETANLVLLANAHPNFEMFVIPAANMVISSLLLLGCLKLFSSMVVFYYRERYLDINDTEASALVAMRETNKKEYMHSIHTAYFCERIGSRLGMDVDALKGAGYYHRMGDELTELMEAKQFPPAAKQILLEYRNQKQEIRRKETAVLLCSDMVIGSILYMLNKDDQRQIDYDKVIDAVFKKLDSDGTFENCDITIRELHVMKKIFKEEKLYYDFLH